MPAPKFEASLRRAGPRVILDLSGEIDSEAEEGLNTIYAAAEQDNPQAIILNFDRVQYINSTGIALIVGLLARARKDHRHLIAFGLSEHYTELFTITRLSDFIDVLPDEPHALAAAPGESGVGQSSTPAR